MFSACGLNCGLCPRYHMNGETRCPGCAGEDFSAKHPSCGVLSCSQRRGVEYCCQCDEYPCKKYDGADLVDSFITHLNQLKDFDKARRIGLDAYEAELNRKVELLRYLLDNFDDGRRKSLFCTAVNLLSIQDTEYVIKQATEETGRDAPVKEKAAAAARIFHAAAENRNISLQLRRKPKSL